MWCRVGIGLGARTGGGGGAAIEAATYPDSIVHGAIGTWHFNRQLIWDVARSEYLAPAALADYYDPLGNITNGEQSILRFARNGEYLGKQVVKTGAAFDDHNNPSICIYDGRLIVAVNDHGLTDLTTFYWSTDTNPANLGAGTAVDMGLPTSYGQFHVIGTTLWLVVQVGDSTWEIWRNLSAGDPTAWVKISDFVSGPSGEQLYVVSRVVGTNIAIVAWLHPVNSTVDEGSFRAAVLDPLTETADWSTMAEILDVGPTERLRLLTANENLTQFGYVRFTEDTHTAQSYYLARLTGSDRTSAGDWTFEDLAVDTNASFWESSHYVEGLELTKGSDATATTIYVALTANVSPQTRTLERWTRATAGDAWTKTTIATSTDLADSGDYFNARPLAPHGTSDNFVLFQSIVDYTTFTDSNSRMVALYGDGPLQTDQIRRNGENVGVSGSKLVKAAQFAQYADPPDISTWSPPFDLTGVEEGDLVVMAVANNISVSSVNRIPTSVTVGGLVLTLQVSTTDPSASRAFTGIYSGVVPPGGLSGGTTILWPAVQAYQDAALAFFRGVGSATPTTTRVDNSNTSAGTFSFADGDVIVSLALNQTGSTVEVVMAPDVRVARRVIGVSASARVYYGVGEVGPATPTTFDFDWDGSGNGAGAWAVWR